CCLINFLEWYLGNFPCKLSVWINGTTVCASVYTLVAVTGDRYFAICRPMHYNLLEKRKVLYIILPIWVVSCALFVPWLLYFKEVKFQVDDVTTARVCVPHFPTRNSEKLFFVIVNLLIAFFIPLTAITACYMYIYITVKKLRPMAVDRQAKSRGNRTKTKITQMMITVVIGFAMSWLPLYLLFLYFYIYEPQMENTVGQVLYLVLRPLFQWLSLSNSCINPIFYAHFSHKFRRMFRLLLIHPCNCHSSKTDYGELEIAPFGHVNGTNYHHRGGNGGEQTHVRMAYV
ncbi:unnamed protein product, partial [Soboliphyme baturini]|uniref:G_PROTEIN_RECEP_F1_2 domain-containing protein n=1 Tax=Soboliphyme baturini TaxID=241478 RepID=A0A183I8T0_9BILA